MSYCIICGIEIDDTDYGYFGYCSLECLRAPEIQECECYICGEIATQIISHTRHEGLSFCSDMCLHEFEVELNYHNNSSFLIEPEPESEPEP